MKRIRLSVGLCLLLAVPGVAPAGDDFHLKDGDRVVFYGDSITDQRLYTTFVETYAVTRFPKWDLTFVHSGWGGDRVTGGGGGPIDVRLERDVFAYKPTVVTVMLGMNDASYRAFDEKIFETFAKGYKHLVESIKGHLPGVRITLIQPSPFDDVTRPPNFEGGYNAVLVRYGEYLKELAKEEGADVADLNTSVVEATKKANEKDAEAARKLNPDRIHPGPGGQLLMAAALLRDWKAPAVVSVVEIDADGGKVVRQEKTNVEGLSTKEKLAWEQTDEALPFPINLNDPIIRLAVESSNVLDALDRETLKVTGGLKDGDVYRLTIDGQEVGKFKAAELAGGINLAEYPTPMRKQAEEVHRLTLRHGDLHQLRWRQVQVPFQKESPEGVAKAIEGLDGLEADLIGRQREAARPKTRRYELAPVE